MTAKKASKLDLTLQAFGRRAFDEKSQRSTDAVVSKLVRRQAQSVSVDVYLESVRRREPRLYERAAMSFTRWLAQVDRSRSHLELAPDGQPYSLGPNIPKKPKDSVSLSDIITQYEQDLKASDA